MRKYLLNTFLLLSLLVTSSNCKGDALDKAIIEINQAPDWRTIHFPNDGTEGQKLIRTLMKYVNYTPEDARELVNRLVISGGTTSNQEIGGKVYLFNRLYCNVSQYSNRDGWKVFGGWGGVAVNETTINSLYPLEQKDGGFKLELFSGYAGPPYQGLEEFDWLLKRFGQRFKAIAAVIK